MPHSRRSVLQWLALGVPAAAFVGACAPTRLGRNGSSAARPLAPVLVSPDRVIREVAGLRPFRRTGFNVSVEPLDRTLIVHNYGHGGCGVTLSWGTAHLAVRYALASPHRDTAVIGCGAVGLATARLLQDHGFNVTLYARDLPPNTTSNVAGAVWEPFSVVDRSARTPAFDAQLLHAADFAFRYFQHLVSPRYGVRWLEEYQLYASELGISEVSSPEYEVVGHIGPPTAALPPGQHPFGALHVLRTLRMHIEPSVYLQTVLTDFRLAGGRIVVRDFAQAQDIVALPHPLIVNCTGLGARTLFGDADLMPIKGQLTVLAPQSEIDYLTIGPGNLYMMPRQDGIILGGTFERGEWSLAPDPAHSSRILQGHEKLFASMARERTGAA